MNFREKYDYGKITAAADLIETIVEREDRPGEIETLRAKVDELAKIVGYMASMMPPDELRQFASHFGWEEVK